MSGEVGKGGCSVYLGVCSGDAGGGVGAMKDMGSVVVKVRMPSSGPRFLIHSVDVNSSGTGFLPTRSSANPRVCLPCVVCRVSAREGADECRQLETQCPTHECVRIEEPMVDSSTVVGQMLMRDGEW
ncbi:hypothetical protein TcWFU_004190 [Taenia crassiceps]|uniref:Uncharacterized protein n=1 Tax=Taenia crassiceps TaxID=6207 RepID=A0ABR4Q5R7_9CEST